MKKTFLALAAVVAISVFTISCKKDSDEATVVGVWTLSELGVDANSNNTVDAGETQAASALNYAGTLNVSSNNTYTLSTTISGTTFTETGTWSQSGSTITTMNASDTTVININSLTENKMVLKESNQWSIFIK